MEKPELNMGGAGRPCTTRTTSTKSLWNCVGGMEQHFVSSEIFIHSSFVVGNYTSFVSLIGPYNPYMEVWDISMF